MTLTLDPPPGFLFARDLGDPVHLDGAPTPERPFENEDGVLTIDLSVLAPGDYVLEIAMHAGLFLGSHTASVTVHAETAFVADGQTADAGPSHADITVVQASVNEPGSGNHLRQIPLLTDGILELAHIASDVDLDLYKFVVDPGFVGQSAKIRLEVPGQDFDLVLHGPPLAVPLRGTPQHGFDSIEDFIYDLNPDDEILDTETLEDIPHFPEQVGLGAENVVLYAVSSKRGGAAEEIDTGTLVPGEYFVQVSAYNGVSSNSPYLLRLRVNEGAAPQCDVAPFNYAASTSPDLPGSYPAGLNTLFLYNHARMYGDFAGDPDLGDLTDHLAAITTSVWADLGVIAAVVPVDGDPDVRSALVDWGSDAASLCNPHEANDVVREIGELIDGIAAAHPTLRNVVVIGDDSQIPFARIPDGTAISNERTHGVTLVDVNETVGALLASYYLSDDPYGTSAGIAVNNHELFVPEWAVGRLVESPADVSQALNNFVVYEGLLDPSTGGLVTGYDFLEDGALEVEAALAADGFSVTSLINETWTRQDLIDLLADNPFGVASINAHFDQSRALPALGNSEGDESDLFTIGDLPPLSNQLLFSMGCHSGLSLSDVQIGVPDWADSLVGGGNQWIANTGFGYGDSAIVGFSEWLNAEFAARVGKISTGDAWVSAKQDVAGLLYTIDPYHEKILQEFVYYGLPMFRTGPADASAPAHPLPGPGGAMGNGTAIVGGPVPVLALARLVFFPSQGTGPGIFVDALVPGLDSAEVELSLAVGSPSGPGILHEVVTPAGTYYEVDGETLVARGRPVQPLTGIDVTKPDGSGGLASTARGAIITHLAGYQVPASNPLYATPTIDLGDGSLPATTEWYRPEAGDATFPAGLQRLATYIDDEGQIRQRLLFAPGRYVATEGGLQELFTQVEAQIYYPTAASGDAVPPYIRRSIGWHTDDIVHGGIAYFEVTVDGDGPVGDDDVARVYVLFREEGPTSPTPWLGIDLTRVEGTNRWVGGRPRGDFTGDNFEFFIQAIDENTNDAAAAAKGEFFLTSQPQDTGAITITLDGTGPIAGWYTSDVGATATTSSGTITGYRLDGGVVVPWDGGTPIADPLIISGTGGHFLEVFGTNNNTSVAFIALDDDGPLVAAVLSPAAVNGYHAPGAQVSITAVDPFGSGVESIEHCFDSTGTDCDAGGVGVWVPNVPGDTAAVTIDTTTTLRFRATDVVGNTGDEGPPQAVLIDATPPTTTAAASAVPNAAGWYNASQIPLTVTFEATDTESGVESVSYSLDGGSIWTVAAGDSTSLELSESANVLFFATDNVGNFPTADMFNPDPDSESFMIDAALPEVNLIFSDVDLVFEINAAVTVTYTCDDGAGSGIVSCVGDIASGSPVDTSALVNDVEFTAIATDAAGNTSAVTVTYDVVDTVAPEVTVTAPGPGFIYEMGSTVAADYSCSDGGSGIASCVGPVADGAVVSTATEGFLSFGITGTDNAGLSTTVTNTYSVVDITPPTVAAVPDVAPNAAGWNATVVSVTITGSAGGGTPIASIEYSTDGGATWVLVPAATAVVPFNADGTLVLNYRATDSAAAGGNVSAVGSHTLKIDTMAPSVTSGLDGVLLTVGTEEAVEFDCSDAGSGISLCEGVPPAGTPLDTSSIGTAGSFEVTAVDLAGNQTIVEFSYTVAYGVCLLYDPLHEQPSSGAEPIKLALCDANEKVIKNPQTVLTAVVVVDLDTGESFGPTPNDTGNANSGFEFRSRSGGKSYIYNLNVTELIDADTGATVPLAASPSCDNVQPCFALGFVVDSDDVTLVEIAPGIVVSVAGPDDTVYLAEFTIKD